MPEWAENRMKAAKLRHGGRYLAVLEKAGRMRIIHGPSAGVKRSLELLKDLYRCSSSSICDFNNESHFQDLFLNFFGPSAYLSTAAELLFWKITQSNDLLLELYVSRVLVDREGTESMLQQAASHSEESF